MISKVLCSRLSSVSCSEQDKVAEVVTTTLRTALGEAAASDDITLVANAVQKEDYYENGEHF